MTAVLALPTSDPPPVLRPVDPDAPAASLSLDDLGAQIVGLAGRIAAATCRWLLLVADFDRREGCGRFGLPSTARWLAHHCGIAHRTAVEHVRAAKALAAFPPLATAMGAGTLSYSHVRAIARLAREGEHRLVDDLIEVARHGTVAQLEVTVRGLRTVDDGDAAAPDQRREEYVRFGWTPASQASVTARLDPERGALLRSTVDAIARAEGLTQVEAIERMAEIALAALNDSGSAPPTLRGDERAAIVIHVEAATVPSEPEDTVASRQPATRGNEAGAADADASPTGSAERPRPYARLDRGPGLPNAVVERLLCSARIRTMLRTGRGNTLDLGRSSRVVSRRQFRALLLRDGGCAHPGCGSRHGLEAHHVRHWIHGGRTDMANLVLLCRAHHHAQHDGGFTITPGADDRFGFFRHDGLELLARPDPGRFAATARPVEDEQQTDALAATSRWTGQRLDRRWAVDCLAGRRERAGSG